MFGWQEKAEVEVVLFLGGELEELERYFDSVEPAGRVRCRYCMPYESDLVIWAARGGKLDLDELWPQIKSYG